MRGGVMQCGSWPRKAIAGGKLTWKGKAMPRKNHLFNESSSGMRHV